MILLEKVVNGNKTGYHYTPEKKGTPGFISFNSETQQVEIVDLSEYDKELGHSYYAHKALGAVYRMVTSGKLEEKRLLAWF